MFETIEKLLILQDRETIAIHTVNQPDTEYVLKNDAYLYVAKGRYNAGYGMPAMAWGSTGADAA